MVPVRAPVPALTYPGFDLRRVVDGTPHSQPDADVAIIIDDAGALVDRAAQDPPRVAVSFRILHREREGRGREKASIPQELLAINRGARPWQ